MTMMGVTLPILGDAGMMPLYSSSGPRFPGPVRGLAPRPRPAAGARVHGLPPVADGGGGRARERGAGAGLSAELAVLG